MHINLRAASRAAISNSRTVVVTRHSRLCLRNSTHPAVRPSEFFLEPVLFPKVRRARAEDDTRPRGGADKSMHRIDAELSLRGPVVQADGATRVRS